MPRERGLIGSSHVTHGRFSDGGRRGRRINEHAADVQPVARREVRHRARMLHPVRVGASACGGLLVASHAHRPACFAMRACRMR